MCDYFIKDFNPTHLGIYEKCFRNPNWLKLYGFNEDTFKFDNYIQKSVLQYYPNVERIVILNSKSLDIFFAHICYENNSCVIVGGLIPELLNSGRGIFCALVIFDFIFRTNKINSINVSILKTNLPSLRMVTKLGFIKLQSKQMEQQNEIKFYLLLTKETYPNSFTQNLLRRIKYAKI